MKKYVPFCFIIVVALVSMFSFNSCSNVEVVMIPISTDVDANSATSQSVFNSVLGGNISYWEVPFDISTSTSYQNYKNGLDTIDVAGGLFYLKNYTPSNLSIVVIAVEIYTDYSGNGGISSSDSLLASATLSSDTANVPIKFADYLGKAYDMDLDTSSTQAIKQYLKSGHTSFSIRVYILEPNTTDYDFHVAVSLLLKTYVTVKVGPA